MRDVLPDIEDPVKQDSAAQPPRQHPAADAAHLFHQIAAAHPLHQTDFPPRISVSAGSTQNITIGLRSN
jgi:hypothetical protein